MVKIQRLRQQFKQLRGWLLTSRTLKQRQGMQILSACAPGSDLELIVNELPLETLVQEDGGRIVYDHIYKTYKEYIELSMTEHLKAALYSDECKRRRVETLIHLPKASTLPLFRPSQYPSARRCQGIPSHARIPVPLGRKVRTITVYSYRAFAGWKDRCQDTVDIPLQTSEP